ncbi:MAG: CBS domain-containing protein [Acidobacteria bacterium]|nr:CBS domain-containing protein [Acidobacteriota bacterium]
MRSIPAIKTVMTPFPYSVDLDAPLSEARRLMREHEIRHLPVKDELGELVGVLTDRDLKLVLGPYVDSLASAEPRVRHACHQGTFTVETGAPLDEVVGRMAEERLGSVLVTKDGRLAGIFTVVDACQLLARLLRAEFAGGDDAA